MKDGVKDKDQSIVEFYESLQMEYIVCELRGKIYPREKDKRYYKKISTFKREKIEDISERNEIPSIFNCSDYRKTISKRVFNEYGLPNFLYRDEDERLELEPKDIYFYYSEGADVKVKCEDGLKFGVITRGVVGEWRYIDNSRFKQLSILNRDTIEVRFRGESESKVILASMALRIV